MAIEHVEATALWQRSLATRENDSASKYRDRLRSALLTMRENVIPFVRNIHRDVLGLTVHEESHLDALWQTATCIAGDDFELTPIEAFVFGASILLHDTGLAVAAYPGGLADLAETAAWRDAEAGARARRVPASTDPLSREEQQTVLFATLRKLHAEQAERLISFTFKRPNREEAIPLLQDVGLHDALGAAIGRIAHSHHWNSNDLTSKLVTHAGTIPGFPPEWTLNELKVACLLRCADAAHIDALRAPTMLFAISDVAGVSAEHWTFQNKLNSVTRAKDKLVFYAGQPFRVDEASSWWLAYDTMQMVDGELKSSNAILEESGSPQFAATGVYGIEAPRLLSKTVRVEGWTPISAEVKVSDPVHLARTLGGRNLYGSGAIAPVRELLQNAVDAVRARRAHQNRESDWGKIRLIIESPDSDPSEVWLHVDDQGTGMSERVVTGPLIDFGKSFWSSTLMDEEFPGLRSHAPKLVGKFGIGFFSIFLLGEAVRVITRRFDASENSAAVLSFDELTRRPLLRRAATGELPLDYTTRVSVKLNDKARAQLAPNKIGRYRAEHLVSFVAQVVHLIAAVDVDIEIIDRVHGETRKHSGQWLVSPAATFLEEVCSLQEPRFARHIVSTHADRVRQIVESDGTVVGRGALLVSTLGNEGSCIVSVGGFSAQRHTFERHPLVYDEEAQRLVGFIGSSSVVGVVIGDTQDAARVRASVTASRDAIARWAKEQDDLINIDRFTPAHQVEICHALLRLGAESSRLPFGFLGGRFATVEQFRQAIGESTVVDIPINHTDYRNSLNFRDINKLTTPYFTSVLHATVAVVSKSTSSDLLSEEDRREIVERGRKTLDDSQVKSLLDDYALRQLSRIATEVWCARPIFTIERVNLIAGNAPAGRLDSWAFRFNKAN
ncbi:hypothetical protein [Sphingobium sp. B11D3A]|uniref:HD domain-containing protein n=1 Tax=Sphingobium sp. B11D3A TaxID=2940574 RepID=UPI0022248A54|nr:hypothetical protein [Sphingobium sp. B11D3A]MCW2393252.1 hypothetical protein [Sphingobium sp. B11D3A]